jgi:hypothetical protein
VKSQTHMRSNVQGAFDCIRAWCMCVKWALHSNVYDAFEHMRVGVCVCDGALQSNRRK